MGPEAGGEEPASAGARSRRRVSRMAPERRDGRPRLRRPRARPRRPRGGPRVVARPVRADAHVRGPELPAGRRALPRARVDVGPSAPVRHRATPSRRTPDDLPRTFRAFLEHAAAHRRVLVIVDAAESARVPPYASYAAAAVEGLGARANANRATRGTLVHRRRTRVRRSARRVPFRREPSAAAPPHRTRLPTTSRDNRRRRARRLAPAVPALGGALRRRVPRGGRRRRRRRRVEASRRRSIRRAPSAVVAYPMPPLTPETPARVVARPPPVAMRANDDDNEAGISTGVFSRVVSPTRAPPTRTKPGIPVAPGLLRPPAARPRRRGPCHRSLVVDDRAQREAAARRDASVRSARRARTHRARLRDETERVGRGARGRRGGGVRGSDGNGRHGGGTRPRRRRRRARRGAVGVAASVARGSRLPGTARALARSAPRSRRARGAGPGRRRGGVRDDGGGEVRRGRGGGGGGGGGGFFGGGSRERRRRQRRRRRARDDDAPRRRFERWFKSGGRKRSAAGAGGGRGVEAVVGDARAAEAWAEASAPFEHRGGGGGFLFPATARPGLTGVTRVTRVRSAMMNRSPFATTRSDTPRSISTRRSARRRRDGTPSRVAAHRRLASFFRDEVFGMTGKSTSPSRSRSRSPGGAAPPRPGLARERRREPRALRVGVLPARRLGRGGPPRRPRGVRRRRARAGVAFDDSSSGRVFVRRIVRRIVPGGVLGRVGARLSLLDGRGVAGAGLEHGDRDADDPHEQIGAAKLLEIARRGAREADLGEMRRSGDALARQMGERAGAALATSAALGWIGARDVAARVLERARQWFGEPKSRSGVTVARNLRARERGAREDFKRRVLRRFRGVSLRGRRRRLRRLPPSIVRGPGARARGAPASSSRARTRGGATTRGSRLGLGARRANPAGGAAHCLRAPEATSRTPRRCAPTSRAWSSSAEEGAAARGGTVVMSASPRSPRTARRRSTRGAPRRRPPAGGTGGTKKVRGEWFEQIQILPRCRVVPRARSAFARRSARWPGTATGPSRRPTRSSRPSRTSSGRATPSAASPCSRRRRWPPPPPRAPPTRRGLINHRDHREEKGTSPRKTPMRTPSRRPGRAPRTISRPRSTAPVASPRLARRGAWRRRFGARRARGGLGRWSRRRSGRRAAALGPGHPSVGAMMTAVAELSRAEGRLEEADAFAREGLAVARREADAAAERKDRVLFDACATADYYFSPRDRRDASSSAASSSASRRAVFEAESRLLAAHRRVSEASRVVARVAWHSGARLEAESRYRAALESAEAADGPAAESVATLACALGAAAKARGRAEEAEACFVHALYADETEARIRIAPGGVGSEGARGRLKVRAVPPSPVRVPPPRARGGGQGEEAVRAGGGVLPRRARRARNLGRRASDGAVRAGDARPPGRRRARARPSRPRRTRRRRVSAPRRAR